MNIEKTIIICNNMKKKLCYFFLLLVLAVPVFSQEAYKGQIFITKQQFIRQGNMLLVNMHVDFEGVNLPSDESFTFTPMLKFAKQQMILSPVIVNGPQKQKVYHRREVLDKYNKKNHRGSIPLFVLKDNKKSSRVFSYKTEVPYDDWMDGSALYVETEECGCNGKKANTYEDKIAEMIKIPKAHTSGVSDDIDRDMLAWITMLAPDDDDKLLSVKGSIPIDGRNGLDCLQEEKCYELYYRIRGAVNSIKQIKGASIARINVTGFTSPIGDNKENERQSVARSLLLKNYLSQTHVNGKYPLDVAWIAEDWDSITSLIKPAKVPLHDAVLDIINSVELVKGRERVLKNLASGIPYKYISERIFPQVCRLEYEVKYNQEPLDAATGRLLLKTRPGSLKLSEFYAIANSYPKGSKEYNDVFDIAARLFPNNPQANINAAAVALTKRDAKLACKYLERFTTLPAAYNNVGLLYLLEGNKDKAEVYLQMAAASGVPQAKIALEELLKNESKK
jgi:hypothetical protein